MEYAQVGKSEGAAHDCEKQVFVQLEYLDRYISNLGEQLGKLLDRLTPVLNYAEEKCVNGIGAPCPSEAPLAEDIRGKAARVNELTKKVCDALGALEI